MNSEESVRRDLLRHFLAALAYRTQKALRDAPAGFESFSAGKGVRTPKELIRHMTSVLGYARTFFVGGTFTADPLPSLSQEVDRFHAMLHDLSLHLEKSSMTDTTSTERLLQGPFSDAMTHAGQLALLRRLFGDPVPPENFMMANISSSNVGPEQSPPVAYGNRHGVWDRKGTADD